MDDRLEKALAFANYKAGVFNNKENIKIKTDTLLTYAINGGIFKSTPELINFTKLLIDRDTPSVVLIDINSNPIEIVDIQSFHDELLSKYFESTNFYNTEYKKLKTRNVKDLFKGAFDD